MDFFLPGINILRERWCSERDSKHTDSGSPAFQSESLRDLEGGLVRSLSAAVAEPQMNANFGREN